MANIVSYGGSYIDAGEVGYIHYKYRERERERERTRTRKI